MPTGLVKSRHKGGGRFSDARDLRGNLLLDSDVLDSVSQEVFDIYSCVVFIYFTLFDYLIYI
jgi:hypothetical protein